ncbi:mediator of RNA polymerase II transcription subunit 28 isoform X2 [Echeneis naucrates]|uniref:mediator of RNA polymerase II transcription subunit 28 isoform X2 n=1 Tax=Echeneis naucrates TaxID=173247 RepID=UPI001113A303|nr:mediator of RNA polymerase II transcription subunit 28 isoform X2 [Echeneis naucrates]
MKLLLLTVYLAGALLHTAESLSCHTCINEACTNTTTVQCPATSTACQSITSVTQTNTSISVTVSKNCSTLLTCLTPLTIATEWSVNLGYTRAAHNQLCCVSDNCNFQTLATPSSAVNGKVCPGCASSADSMSGSCNVDIACVGAENSCFTANTTLPCSHELQLGCTTRNLCLQPAFVTAVFSDLKVTCGAPWSTSISTVILASALTGFKFIV